MNCFESTILTKSII